MLFRVLAILLNWYIVVTVCASDVDVTALLEGVDSITTNSYPGPLCVYGEDAFPVVVADIGTGIHASLIAASRQENGRVVAFGHDHYLRTSALNLEDTAQLMVNVLRWVSDKDMPRIGTWKTMPTFLTWLTDRGFDAVNTDLTDSSLAHVDVVVAILRDLSDTKIRALEDFISRGGGVVSAENGWWWHHHGAPSHSLSKHHVGNHVLAAFGIQWTTDVFWIQSGSKFLVSSPSRLTHAGLALDAIQDHTNGVHSLSSAEIRQATDSVSRAMRCAPRDDEIFIPRMNALAENAQENEDWPSADRPVLDTDVLARLLTTYYVVEHARTPAELVKAHVAGNDFPGEVSNEAVRDRSTISIDTSIPRRHSTGLYAAPGEEIVLLFPHETVATGRFNVVVGAHTDGIWPRAEWNRMPEISRTFSVTSIEISVANAFGGLLYIDVPNDVDLGTISVEVRGAIAAPRYVLGETNLMTWRDDIRNAPGPWAEIEGRNMIVTTPSEEIRNLDDPVAVAETWDRALDLAAELASHPYLRESPERIVVDRQISHGYMHAGYPIMAHLDQSNMIVNDLNLSTCPSHLFHNNWGLFHEVGHNHQSADWTFDGTVEVTVNLFTLYLFEKLCGVSVDENARGSREFRIGEIAKYDFNNPDFQFWKQDPFVALIKYIQIQQEFGWDAYQRVFSEYRDLPQSERPTDDVQKRNQWLQRLSHTVGYNLAPFFELWGIPTTQEAQDVLIDLPVWLPPDPMMRHPAHVGDLNGDGSDDLLLRHLDGRWFYYSMNGRSHNPRESGFLTLTQDRSHSFQGLGDFDGDGDDDILMRNNRGNWSISRLNGRRSNLVPYSVDLPSNRAYQFVVTDDFDGDGDDDILLRHNERTWYYQPMENGEKATVGGGEANIVLEFEYKFMGSGDFNGDGSNDVLFRQSDGTWYYFQMHEDKRFGEKVPTNLPTLDEWRLAGVGDFDGDSKDDVLLRHLRDGNWYLYPSADGRDLNAGAVQLTNDVSYQVVAVGDLNGDGKYEVSLRRNTGEWFYYALSGRSIENSGTSSLTRDLRWQITRTVH